MRQRAGADRVRRAGAWGSLALAFCLLPADALAVDTVGPAWADWRHDWSLLKWLLCLALMLVAWELSFRLVFKRLLDPQRNRSPRPRDAFARAMATFFGASVALFMLSFIGALTNGKGEFMPASLWFLLFLNSAWPLAVAALVMVVGYFVVYALFRGPRAAGQS